MVSRRIDSTSLYRVCQISLSKHYIYIYIWHWCRINGWLILIRTMAACFISRMFSRCKATFGQRAIQWSRMKWPYTVSLWFKTSFASVDIELIFIESFDELYTRYSNQWYIDIDIYLSITLSIVLSITLSIDHSIYHSIYLSISSLTLSVYLSIYLSI